MSDPSESVRVEGVHLLRDRVALQEALAELREGGDSLALVPTMGYLHEGHLSLVDQAHGSADTVLLTIFVNPLQFGEGEDLEHYPTDLEGDVRKARARGVTHIFAPPVSEMYPDGPPVIRVDPGPMGKRLCGISRPHHFPGVLTVVARLFALIRPDVAVFGRKDYQQAVLIRQMVRDLALDVDVQVGPLVREHDGLALSSRNVYLSPIQREVAPRFQAELARAASDFLGGMTEARHLVSGVRDRLERGGGMRVEYIEVVHPETLLPMETARVGAVLAGAVHIGSTRLIDNVLLGVRDEDPRLPPSDRSRRA